MLVILTELVYMIAKLNGIDIDVENIDYFRRCNILNQNPVLTARHFQYRIEVFFKEILLHEKSPVGHIYNYVIKIEFQFRGSPHCHSFLWSLNCPILTTETIDDYIAFIDRTIRVDLPDPVKEPELHNLVSQYQIHSHSNSCRKYKNVPCRFNYGRFFTDRTIVSIPLQEAMPDSEKSIILKERKTILKLVKDYIDEFLDPHKPSYIGENKTIPDILSDLDILESDYYKALSISADQDFQIHYRRTP